MRPELLSFASLLRGLVLYCLAVEKDLVLPGSLQAVASVTQGIILHPQALFNRFQPNSAKMGEFAWKWPNLAEND